MALSVTGGGTQYSMQAQMMAIQQMYATDQQQAQTIQTQIAADAQKQRMERFKLMADLQTKIFEMTQEITLTKAKAAQKAFQGMNSYISS
jgi:hypothetical protein